MNKGFLKLWFLSFLIVLSAIWSFIMLYETVKIQKNEIDVLKDTIQSQTVTITALEKHLEEQAITLVKKENQHKKLQNTLQKRLLAAEREVENNLSQKQEINEKLQQAKQKVLEIQAQKQEEQAQIKNLQEKIATIVEGRDLLAKRLQQDNQSFKEALAEKQAEKQMVLQDYEIAKKTIASLQTQLEVAQKQAEETLDARPLDAVNQKDYKNIKTKLEDTTIELDHILRENQKLKRSNEYLQEQVTEQRLELALLEENKADLEGEWAELMSRSRWQEIRIAQAQQEAASLDTQLAYLTEDMQKEQSEKNTLSAELAKLQKNITQENKQKLILEEQLKQFEKEGVSIDSILIENKNLKQDQETLAKKLATCDTEVNTLLVSQDKMTAEMQALQSDIASLKADITRKEAENIHLKQLLKAEVTYEE